MPALHLRSVGNAALSSVPESQGAHEPQRLDSGIMMISDRPALAAGVLEEAADLLACGLLEQAGERFQAAARAYDELGDAAGGARALLGLGRVLLGLEDPVCREVLEDAGTRLEDLGDEARVREIDGLLRVAECSIEVSPRSFHARTSSAPPPPQNIKPSCT